MNRNVLAAIILAAMAWPLGAGDAKARPDIASTWRGIYENVAGPCPTPSNSLLNVLQGTGGECQFCHVNPSGSEPWNGYGWAIKQLLDLGSTTTDAILGVEPEESDGDPEAAINFDEVCTSTQPGWTDGANNTIFCVGPSANCGGNPTLENQNPPAGILGTLDPVSVACEVVLDQATYTSGDTVTAQVFQITNPTAEAVAIELKSWLEFPGRDPIPHLRVGADGSIVLTPGFDRDFGPMALTTITGMTPLGSSSFNCRLLDPVTGEPQSLDTNPFEVQ